MAGCRRSDNVFDHTLLEADAALAVQHEITSIPAFVVNGILVSGAYPLEHFQKVIDRLLGKLALM